MVSALFYLQFHSARNRLVTRIKRLKQPKYLAGGIVGLLYFYFYFGRYLFRLPGRGAGGVAAGAPSEYLALYESLGALFLLAAFLVAWLFPHERAVLRFTEAEVAFLFPAPISRRGLIHFKLVRSQIRILMTSLILMLVSHRFGGKLWIHAIGWWVILSTMSLHWTGSSFARTMLLERGIPNWQRRLAILGLTAIAAGVVIVWARRSLPAPEFAQMNGPEALRNYAEQVLTSGPLPYLLYPFRLVVRPYLAATALGFVSALAPALVLLLLLYVWVIRSNVAFEEASAEAAERLAARIASARTDPWRATGKRAKVRRPPFELRPIGPPAVGLLWKNIIGAGQVFTPRLWILFIVLAVVLGLTVGQMRSTEGTGPVIAMIASMLLAWSLLIGPQVLRQDFRQDLPLSDLIKTYPLRGWQIALGEVLAPVLILTAIQWLLLVVAAIFVVQVRDARPHMRLILSCSFGAAFILPMLDLILLQIPNAAVLLLPAWFQASKDGPRGVEATGQRLIFVLGQLLVLVLTLLPAALVFTAIFFLMQMFLAVPVAVPIASIAAAVVLAGEGALGLMLLGRLFERFDVTELAVP